MKVLLAGPSGATAATYRDGGHVAEFLRLRPVLFSVTYRMTGSVADAEDLVSEVFLRMDRAVREGRVIRSRRRT